MRRILRFGHRCFPALFAGICFAGFSGADAQQAAFPAITRDGYAVTTGAVKATQQLDRMLLLLEGTAEQQRALDTLLSAQLTPGNANYHKWLTPAQFAARFAPSASDVAKVVEWLRSQGFTMAALPASRGWIEFSGTAAQVQQAFGASVQEVVFNTSSLSGLSSDTRFRLAGDAQIPTAIVSQVKGLVSLDGSLSIAAATTPVERTESVHALQAETSVSSATPLTPRVLRNWLQLTDKNSDDGSAATRGAGETIAIPARSNVRPDDFLAFRTAFHLPESALHVTLAGADPGRTADEAGTMQAASWAGVAAPEARIVVVAATTTNATDGFDLALAATIDGAQAHTISVGYSACESSLSAAHQAFYASLYRQAAAEGIAVIAATGDSGAAACHLPSDTSPVSTGYQVNGLASTPWNTAIGAVDFATDGKSLTGWQSTGNGAALYATGGGASNLYPTPAWQVALGLPSSDPGTTAAHHRYLPDLSLPTAVSNNGSNDQVSQGLAFCLSGDSVTTGCRLVSAGGSSGSAGLFSGIAAVLAQRYGAQGNLAGNLYALNRAANASLGSAFVDVKEGNAQLQCVAGSANCEASGNGEGLIGFASATGYDLVSGLGSIHADALIADWAKTQAVGTAAVTVTMTSATGITYNPTSDITLSATVAASSGTTIPTGTVQFYDETTAANVGTAVTLSSTGTASYVTEGALTSGGHNIQAQYSGDTTFEAASSTPVTFEIEPSATSLVVVLSTTKPAGGASVTVTGTVTATNLGTVAPTGKLTVNLDGVAQGNATLSTISGITSAAVSVVVPASGSHTIQGLYSGDSNYNTSTSPSVTVAVAKTASVTTISATPSALTSGTTETFTATVAPVTTVLGTSYVLTGSVSFYDASTTLLGTAAVSGDTAILTGVTLSATSSHTVTAVYTGDATYSTSTSAPLLLSATLLPVTVTLTESSTILTTGQPVTLTATVTPVSTPPSTAEQHPSGYVLFYAGTTLISGQIPVVQEAGYSSVASTTLSTLTPGSSVITAQYFGDTTYGAAVSNSVTLTSEDFSISCNVSNVSVVQGSTAAPSPVCTVASLGGLTGDIEVTCTEQNPPQVRAIACNFNPTVITTSGTSTLSIVTTAGNLASNSRPRGGSTWPVARSAVALAFAGVLLWPIGRRARWLRSTGSRLLALSLLLGGLAVAGMGCTNTVTLSNNGGTPLGVHTLKITAGAVVNTVTVTHNAYITVNVTE